MTLIEVSFASLIVGIIAVVAPTCLINAANVRMDARKYQAALIEANSLLEHAFATSDRSIYDLGDGFFNRNMVHSTTNPLAQWAFDDDLLSLEVEFKTLPHNLAFISVIVETAESRPVSLSMYRYCKE